MDCGKPAETDNRISRRTFNAALSATVATAACAAGGSTLADNRDTVDPNKIADKPVTPDQFGQAVYRGIEFLRSTGQAEDGSFGVQAGVGITALVAAAILRHGRSSSDPMIAKSLKYIEKNVQPEGGIFSPGGMVANYETCLAVMCLKEAAKNHQYDQLIRKAEAYIRAYQWDETNGKDPSDPSYGGAGYGKHQRPDLSNTAFMIDTIKSCRQGAKDSGDSIADDPAIQKALIFVSRCQNMESEHNTTQFADKNPDGGFYYTSAAGGQSAAGMTDEGGLRSYASMTYSGLKSMIYAGLAKDDPRVKAAFTWIRNHYDLKSNPGMGSAGLYYYYHVFAKTMDAIGDEMFEDGSGLLHDWKQELSDVICRAQLENGSWVNENSRWMESDPNLTTAYALLALSYCQKTVVQ